MIFCEIIKEIKSHMHMKFIKISQKELFQRNFFMVLKAKK